MATSYTWNFFPIAGTANYESVGRSTLEQWRSNCSDIDEEVTGGRAGFGTLLLHFEDKSDTSHIHTPAGDAINVSDLITLAFFYGRR